MRELLFISLLLSLGLTTQSQTLEYEEVFSVDSNITKDELFNRARSWFVDYYKDANEVLQVSDKESGELIGAAIYKYSFLVGGGRMAMTIDYRVSVKMKEGRYKVSIYNLYNSKSSNNGSTPYNGIGEITENHKENKRWLNPKRYGKMTMSIRAYVEVIYQSLFAAMSKPIEKEEDW